MTTFYDSATIDCVMTRTSYWTLLFLSMAFDSCAQTRCGAHSCQEIVIPNVITPNSDNLNDHFQILFQDCFCPVTSLTLVVFNRWGQCVYQEIASSTSEGFTWNGVCEQNKQLTEGIYYYLIHIKYGMNSQEYYRQWKGWVRILR